MKKIYITIGIALVGAASYFVFVGTPEASPVVTIKMDKDGFTPSDIVIKKGDAVEFVNTMSQDCWESDARCSFWPASDLHPTHEEYPEFDPLRPLAPGESWVFRFKEEGKWDFHDHLKARLRGTVTVTKE